jgi:transposase
MNSPEVVFWLVTGHAAARGMRPICVIEISMPYKANAERRYKIPKARYRVTNWPAYDAALVRRGSLTLWVTEEALAAWHTPMTGKRGGQPLYSDLAIETGLALRLVLTNRFARPTGQMAVEKYGIPLAIDVAPANQHDTKAIVPVLRELADGGFQGPALGDLGYRDKRLAEVGQALGITVEAIARGRDGQFMPAGICWVVERSFAWLSRYRRLNTIFERSKEHLIAFVAIAFISILSRRLKRLVVEEISA